LEDSPFVGFSQLFVKHTSSCPFVVTCFLYNTESKRAANATFGGDVQKEAVRKAKADADEFYRTSYVDVKRTALGHSMSYVILMTVNMEITVFRKVTPCILEYIYLEMRF
jgi:hypothetical protein